MDDQALLGYLLAEVADADGINSSEQEEAYWSLRHAHDVAELDAMDGENWLDEAE